MRSEVVDGRSVYTYEFVQAIGDCPGPYCAACCLCTTHDPEGLDLPCPDANDGRHVVEIDRFRLDRGSGPSAWRP